MIEPGESRVSVYIGSRGAESLAGLGFPNERVDDVEDTVPVARRQSVESHPPFDHFALGEQIGNLLLTHPNRRATHLGNIHYGR